MRRRLAAQTVRCHGHSLRPGNVNAIHTGSNEVDIVHADGTDSTLSYQSLVLATGSRLFRPSIPGLRDHAFSIDQIDEAAEPEGHCRTLAQLG
jgi:NADH dehydrogenase